jgi:hypothetical protein
MEMNERSGRQNRVSKGEQSVGIVGSLAKERGVTQQGITSNGLGSDAELFFK